jgi:hypothetical protein
LYSHSGYSVCHSFAGTLCFTPMKTESLKVVNIILNQAVLAASTLNFSFNVSISLTSAAARFSSPCGELFAPHRNRKEGSDKSFLPDTPVISMLCHLCHCALFSFRGAFCQVLSSYSSFLEMFKYSCCIPRRPFWRNCVVGDISQFRASIA